MLRKVLGTLVALAASAALAGCNSTVHTSIDVQSANQSSLSVGVDFTGQIGAKLASDAALRQQLEQVISARTGQAAVLVVNGQEVSWSQSLSYSQVTANSDVTGLASASLVAAPSNEAKLSMNLVDPKAIVTAITKGVAGEPQAASLVSTMETYTFVTQSVTFPGAVLSASSNGPKVSVSGSTASVTQRLSSYQPGSVSVLGSLSGPSLLSSQNLLIAAGVLVVLGGGVVLWRRRS